MASSNEAEAARVRELVERWVRAVRARDRAGILAHHAPDISLFDVPPPAATKGLEAYQKSWDLFFAWADDPVLYEVQEMSVVASSDVAFVAALMRCAGTEPSGEKVQLEFRLTMGLEKIAGQWTVVHEHHSIPATE